MRGSERVLGWEGVVGREGEGGVEGGDMLYAMAVRAGVSRWFGLVVGWLQVYYKRLAS